MPCITASMTGAWITSVLLPWVYSCMMFHAFIVPNMNPSFTWMATFGDPSFKYHKAAAQLWGAAALRLADDAVQ